jgi:hypothetical protein
VATILESYEVESPEHGRPFKIDLVEGLDGAHIDFIEQQWHPILQRQNDLALLNFFQLPVALQTKEKWHEMLGKFGAQDSHWEWRTKCSVASGTNRRIFALLSAGDVEAAMCLSFEKQSRATDPLPIIYVDYVAVAPWNRKEIQNPMRFRRLGTVMLGTAVTVSISMGLEGRCGLHSLSQAAGFYRRMGMSDFGIDAAYPSLRYFEFNNQAAREFMDKGDL